jgi:hypothetical protein
VVGGGHWENIMFAFWAGVLLFEPLRREGRGTWSILYSRTRVPKLDPGLPGACFGFYPSTIQLIQITNSLSSFDDLNQLCCAKAKTPGGVS